MTGKPDQLKRRLLAIADSYVGKFGEVLPPGSKLEIGGSLRSGTIVPAKVYDIDLRVLIPARYCQKKRILEISDKLKKIEKFHDVSFIEKKWLQDQPFVLKHEAFLSIAGIPGKVKLDVTLHQKEIFVEHARFIKTLPLELVEEYLAFKKSTVCKKEAYKKIKVQFYAMIRWLYGKGYWNEKDRVVGDSRMLQRAKKVFWGQAIEEIVSRPDPKV